jgi:hypothetical protein
MMTALPPPRFRPEMPRVVNHAPKRGAAVQGSICRWHSATYGAAQKGRCGVRMPDDGFRPVSVVVVNTTAHVGVQQSG